MSLNNASYILLTNGMVKAFGQNNFGQLGFAANSYPNPTPIAIAGLTGAALWDADPIIIVPDITKSYQAIGSF